MTHLFSSNGCPGENIDQFELACTIEKSLLFVLAVDIQKPRRDFMKCRNGAGLIIDVDTIPFVGRDLAPDHDLVGLAVEAEAVQIASQVGFENGLDDG